MVTEEGEDGVALCEIIEALEEGVQTLQPGCRSVKQCLGGKNTGHCTCTFLHIILTKNDGYMGNDDNAL